MTGHVGPAVLHILFGVVVGISGALVVRYPDASYAIRTAWKHDDASLSDRGRTDQRLMGAVLLVVGLALVLRGVSYL